MDCPYSENAFCTSLPNSIKNDMCACCNASRFASGCVIDTDDCKDAFLVLADGFILAVDAEADCNDAFPPMEPLGGGSLLTLPASWLDAPFRHTVYYIIKPCIITRFDSAEVEKLREKSLAFAWTVTSALDRNYHEACIALHEVGGKDARRAVKYMLDFCKRHNVSHMTHAQIALATGLARPTVTKALHELMTDDTELTVTE